MITRYAKNTIVLFEPHDIDSSPVKNVPQIEPMLLIEPAHDSSSYVNGPDASGVLFDRSSGNAEENHPIFAPCPTMT